MRRIWLKDKDGIDRLLVVPDGKIELMLVFANGVHARFAGYTINGFLKYAQI